MAGIPVALRGVTAGLPERLRAETRHRHELVEAVADVQNRVHTLDDYVALLLVFGQLHIGLEAQLSSHTWDPAWRGVDVDIFAHCRAGLLLDDLDELGVPVTAFPESPPFPDFGQAMGCLYVLEGSALGGRMIAGMVRAAVGAVPTAFLTGGGRTRQWPAVRNALRRFDAQGGNEDAVVAGALSTFDAFERKLSAPVLQR